MTMSYFERRKTQVLKFNENHDEQGRFTTSGGLEADGLPPAGSLGKGETPLDLQSLSVGDTVELQAWRPNGGDFKGRYKVVNVDYTAPENHRYPFVILENAKGTRLFWHGDGRRMVTGTGKRRQVAVQAWGKKV